VPLDHRKESDLSSSPVSSPPPGCSDRHEELAFIWEIGWEIGPGGQRSNERQVGDAFACCE
jgi:hypothetical protein